jgi:hypothetical protein
MIHYTKTNDLDFCHAGQDALYGEGTQFLPEIKKVVMVMGVSYTFYKGNFYV